MQNLKNRIGRVGGVGVAVLLAGCQLTGVGGQSGRSSVGPAVRITQAAVPSAFLAVASGPASGPALSRLVASTARPDEDISVLQAGSAAYPVVASEAPAPAEKVIPGPPAAASRSQTAYQAAQYNRKVKAWQAMRDVAMQQVAAQTAGETSSWVTHLDLAPRISRLADPSGSQSSLTAESSVAASAMAGLQEEAGNVFGARRVVVLFAADVSGTLPAGELTGDDVIVVTSYLPTVAAASAAQADLLEAGATQASVVGPEVTAAQLDTLVSADLTQGAQSGAVSTPVLFENGSAALGATATDQLTQLLARLRQPGMTAVINGYASVQGTALANYLLSYQRAANTAGFFESRGIPSSSLIIVGHGATAAFGSGASAANRRVIIVTEQAANTS